MVAHIIFKGCAILCPISLRSSNGLLQRTYSKHLYLISDEHAIMDYPFKRGFKPNIDRIRDVLEEMFPCEIKQENSRLLFSYGAMKSVAVWIENKRLFVVTESATDVSDDVVLETNIRYRDLLEGATGYTAKQRLQMAKKEVSKGGED